MDKVFAEARERMNKTINSLKATYGAIRAGRANAAVLEPIKVDYWGVPTPISQMAAVSVTEARVLTIQPWDKSALKLIEKAIQMSDLGINPQNDGIVIRLTFPPLTEERRKNLAKDVKSEAENAKIAIRNIRRDSLEKLKAMKKSSAITEDDLKDGEDEMKKITEEFTKKIDAVAAEKEAEIMEI